MEGVKFPHLNKIHFMLYLWSFYVTRFTVIKLYFPTLFTQFFRNHITKVTKLTDVRHPSLNIYLKGKGAPPHHSGTRTWVSFTVSGEALVFQCPWVSGIPFLSPYTCTRCRFPSNGKTSFISSHPMAEAVSNSHLWTHNQSEFFRGL